MLQIKGVITGTNLLFKDAFIRVSQLLKHGGEQDVEVALTNEDRVTGYHRPPYACLYNGCICTWYCIGQRGEVQEKQTMTRKMCAEQAKKGELARRYGESRSV